MLKKIKKVVQYFIVSMYKTIVRYISLLAIFSLAIIVYQSSTVGRYSVVFIPQM